MKINDWSKVQDEYQNVNTKVEKSKMLTMVHGLPVFYIKMLVDLEEKVLATKKDKEAEKKMKPAIAKAFQQIKLQLKKHNALPEYKDKVEDCRAHPEKYTIAVVEEEDEEEEEVKIEEKVVVADKPTKVKPAKKVRKYFFMSKLFLSKLNICEYLKLRLWTTAIGKRTLTNRLRMTKVRKKTTLGS